MIVKRKNQTNQLKSKEKTKQTKQTKQTKETKKIKKDTGQKAQKLKSCASKKNMRPSHYEKQSNQEVYQQNQNQNRSNLPVHAITHTQKIRAHHDHHAEIQYVNMRRSASVGGLKGIRPVRKSLSPALSKQPKDKSDIKHKYSSKPTSRSQKQKIKQQTQGLQRVKSTLFKKHTETLAHEKVQKVEKQKIVRKKSQKILKNQSQRLKTENSSKIPEGKQKQQKQQRVSQKKKVTKQNKPKSILKTSSSKIKLKPTKIKEYKNSVVFSDVSFHDTSPLYSAIIPRQNFYVKMEKNQQNKVINACVTIQKHFRGYLTRKYIEQTKYMIYSVIKIQKVWRGYNCRRKFKKQGLNKKNLSIQNSLITIKDFSEEHRQQKLKNKCFKFNNEEDSKKKENDSSFKKGRKDESQQKYINILESLLLEQGLDQKYKDKIRVTLGKQKYVKNKIYSQIVSEKSFNSPQDVRSPRSNLVLNSPSSWSKQRQLSQPFQHVCASPRNIDVSQALSKRISSPVQNKSALNSSRRQNTQSKPQIKYQIKPIQTSFEFIEEFELRIVDYLRDNIQIKQNFLSTCQKCQRFRSYLIMSQWNLDKDFETDYFSFLQSDICPDIFPMHFRQEIISQNSMKIYLQDNNYIENLWIQNTTQRSIYQGYIKCIFDSLAEAIYDSYKNEVVTKKTKNSICHYDGHELFKLIFMNSLTLMQGWNEYMCGAQIPVSENDPNYKPYCDKNNQRLQIMIKNSIMTEDFKDHGSVSLWVELAISEAIYQQLIAQFYNEFFM